MHFLVARTVSDPVMRTFRALRMYLLEFRVIVLIVFYPVVLAGEGERETFIIHIKWLLMSDNQTTGTGILTIQLLTEGIDFKEQLKHQQNINQAWLFWSRGPYCTCICLLCRLRWEIEPLTLFTLAFQVFYSCGFAPYTNNPAPTSHCKVLWNKNCL